LAAWAAVVRRASANRGAARDREEGLCMIFSAAQTCHGCGAGYLEVRESSQ
jgi:hypothetical protein